MKLQFLLAVMCVLLNFTIGRPTVRFQLFHYYCVLLILYFHSAESYCVIYRMVEVGRMCHASSSSSGSPSAAEAPGRILTNWTTDLVSGMVVCVECQPTAAGPYNGDRCQGDGVYARQTRWAALTVPGCKGKWTMIAKPKDCQCLGQNYQHNGQEVHAQKSFIFVWILSTLWIGPISYVSYNGYQTRRRN